jgi:predicted Zn-dependent protease
VRRIPLDFKRTLLAAVTALAWLAASDARAQMGGLIRDTEIENTIRAYGAPIIDAAGLDPAALHYYVVNDRHLNAFVAGGQNIFVTTGLLRRADHAGQVIGVLAHETGHITGGHIAQLDQVLKEAGLQALIAQILGTAVGVLAKNPNAPAVLGGAGVSTIGRALLHYNRGQEQAADQAGLRFLDAAHISARGLYEFLDILSEQELLSSARQDPYLLTHPLTRDRIDFVRNALEQSRWSNTPVAAELNVMHRRMRAKLEGFLDPPQTTLLKYKEADRSVYARYARAVALYRVPNISAAVQTIDGLLAENPRDPYFLELKGQMLFENGKIAESIPPLEAAVKILPNAPLIREMLGHALIEMNEPEKDAMALTHLRHGLRIDPQMPQAWRFAATAYGRRGELAMASLCLAESNIITGRREEARAQARRAKQGLKEGSPGWLRAEDILTATYKPGDEERERDRDRRAR